MRDEAYMDHRTGVAAKGSRVGAAFGAVASVAVLAGLVGWSYNLGVRDAGDVPVIRALEGAMRERPTDPGGARFAHQDRQVYDLMRATSEPAEREVMLAPSPEPLADDDVAFSALDPAPAQPLPASVETDAVAGGAALSLDDLVASVVGDDVPARSGSLTSPLAPVRPGRPGSGETRVAAAVPLAASVEVRSDATTLAPGRPAIQLGAYLSEEMAQEMWREIATRNGDLLAGRQPVVTPLVGSSRTLYGLRAAPFADEAEARSLCAAMRARSEDCLVTELR